MNWFCVLLLSISCVLAAPQSAEVQKTIRRESASPYLNQPSPRESPEDAGLTVIELIEKYGYPVEIHHAQTDDGYILEMHRIPYGKNNQGVANKPVAFLQHGLLCSSADWVLMGPQQGLAYLLADMGYDVWMGNARGNTWSRKHTTYDPDNDKKEFWTFSWNEIGYYDLPAMIDYALDTTGQQQVYYVGHSQATTAFFVMTSERPEYNSKIRLMASLAPIAFMSNITNPFLRFLAIFDDTLEFLGDLIGLYEFFPSYDFLNGLGDIACSDGAFFQEVCSNILFLIAGFDSDQLNRTMLPVILSNTPAGASVKQLIHYAQGINSGYFRKYDYGWIENLIKYGSLSPPDYDLNQVTAPVSLFYGNNDWLAGLEDVFELAGKLPNNVYQHEIDWSGFNHLDFLWAIDVVPLVYEHIFKLMEIY